MSCPMHRIRGFTLIEMLIVVVVVGVMAMVAAPSVGRGVAQARVKRAASIVAGDLEVAVTNAARQRKPIRITFTSGTRSYTVADRATGEVLMSRDFGPGSELALNSFGASAAILDIYPNGIASSADTVTLRIGTHSRRVIVTRAGLIRGMQ
jgi:prepilin-type N-terminal cleavage/methylation domain-containing protein